MSTTGNETHPNNTSKSSPFSHLYGPLAVFALLFILSHIVAMAVAALLEAEQGSSGAMLAMAALSAAFAGQRFSTKCQRLPDRVEYWFLVLASTALAVVIEAAFTFGILALLDWATGGNSPLVDLFTTIPTALLVGVAIFTVVMLLVCCMLGYGPMARGFYRQMVKKGKLPAAE